MNAEDILEQLNILNKNYIWIIKESEKLIPLIDKAWKTENFSAIEKYRNKFFELENRHKNNRKTYNKIIQDSRQYFLKKHNIDIIKIFKLEDI